jgi:transcription termination factor Rho
MNPTHSREAPRRPTAESSTPPVPVPTFSGVFESQRREVGPAGSPTGRFVRHQGGFVRSRKRNYQERPDDPMISARLCQDFDLRGGEEIEGELESPDAAALVTHPRVKTVKTVNGLPAANHRKAPIFEDLRSVDPYQPLRFERENGPLSMRVLDLLLPVALGQRVLIVAPPRSGRTILLQQLAASLAANYPQTHHALLLIDERPEEVTEVRRVVPIEVVAGSTDQGAYDHIRLARLMVERAKRIVETGRDAVILLDSVTALCRAFHAVFATGSRSLDGTISPEALEATRVFLGAARNFDEAGSLTIIATLLSETGRPSDDRICQEIRRTEGPEIVLSRELSRQRVWPAIDLGRSTSSLAEQFLSTEAIEALARLRHEVERRTPPDAMGYVLDILRRYESNEDFVLKVD